MPPTNEDLRKAYRLTAFIGLAMMAFLVLYTVLIEIVKKENAPFGGYAPMPGGFETLRYTLLAIVAAEFFLIRLLQRLMLSGKVPIQSSPSTALFSPGIQRLISASVVTFGLCESVAVIGLVLFFMQGSNTDFYLFLFLSLLFFIVHFPKYDAWEEWISDRERERRPQP